MSTASVLSQCKSAPLSALAEACRCPPARLSAAIANFYNAGPATLLRARHCAAMWVRWTSARLQNHSIMKKIVVLAVVRSEEHTSELQSPCNLACRLLLANLKKHQRANGSAAGSWSDGHSLGYAALPALTLLVCGVPANDPQIPRIAAFLPPAAPATTDTY